MNSQQKQISSAPRAVDSALNPRDLPAPESFLGAVAEQLEVLQQPSAERAQTATHLMTLAGQSAV